MDATIPACFLRSADLHPDRPAVMYKREACFTPVTFRDLRSIVGAVAAGLRELGVGAGDRVGLLSANRWEWLAADLAALTIGAVTVPICHTMPAAHVEYILQDAGIRLLFVENQGRLRLVRGVRKRAPALQTLVLFDGPAPDDETRVFEELAASPELASEARSVPLAPDDLATIVYTSGTTGEPKGVMLSHANIVSNAAAAGPLYHVTCEDVTLSYLPLSHMFERTCGHYALLFAGGCVAYAESLGRLMQDVTAVRPTIILAVPSVIERIHSAAAQRVEAGPRLRRAFVRRALRDLNTYANRRYRRQRIPWTLLARCLIHQVFVARRFRRMAGGRLRLIVVGGAPLDPHTAKVLYDFGFNIVEGYGMTEAAPCIATNTVETNRLGTVGKPFPSVEVRIGADDEILVKGPNVMKGYYNRPEESRRVLDADGWLHTGDQGRFDEQGNLCIIGRLKELIVTAHGKKIAPTAIEARIARSPYVSQVMVYGDKRRHLVALVVPNDTAIRAQLRTEGATLSPEEESLQLPSVIDLLRREIDGASAECAAHEKVRAFAVVEEPWTVENETLTPTLKLRRNKIAEMYGQLLEGLYRSPRA